jgi:hypothetical protein
MLRILAATPSETEDGIRAKRLALEQADCGKWADDIRQSIAEDEADLA